MRIDTKTNTSVFLIYFLFVLFIFVANPLNAGIKRQPFSAEEKLILVDILAEKGFERDYLERIIHDKRLRKVPVLVSRNIHNNSGRIQLLSDTEKGSVAKIMLPTSQLEPVDHITIKA